jgi:hypothetical protein
VGEGVQVASRGGPDQRHELASLQRRHLPDRVQPDGVQLLRGHRPDAPQTFHRQRMEETQLVLDGHHQQPVGLAQGTRHLREVLRAGDADRDGQPDLLSHVDAELLRDDRRGAADASQAADLEERLVDRDALDDGRGVVEDVEDIAAGLRVRLHPR